MLVEAGAEAMRTYLAGTPADQRIDLLMCENDVLATGGTATAACGLVEAAEGVVAGVEVILELGFLGGRQRLADYPLHTLVEA